MKILLISLLCFAGLYACADPNEIPDCDGKKYGSIQLGPNEMVVGSRNGGLMVVNSTTGDQCVVKPEESSGWVVLLVFGIAGWAFAILITGLDAHANGNPRDKAHLAKAILGPLFLSYCVLKSPFWAASFLMRPYLDKKKVGRAEKATQAEVDRLKEEVDSLRANLRGAREYRDPETQKMPG